MNLVRTSLVVAMGMVGLSGLVGARATRSANRAEALRASARGQVFDIPAVFPDGSTRFHINRDAPSAERAMVRVPAGGKLAVTTLFEDGPPTRDKSRWRDAVGTTTLEAGQLVAHSPRNEVVVNGIDERDVRVQVGAEAGAQMGILVRYQDPDHFILAFYQPREKILGFHEMVDGRLGPQINTVSTHPLTGQKLQLVVQASGARVIATLTGVRGRSVRTRFTVGTLMHAGTVGLYHDQSVGPAAQRFDDFRLGRLDRRVPAAAIEVIVPPAVRQADSVWRIGDAVEVTGIERPGTARDGALRTITIRRPADIVPVADHPTDRTLFPTHLPGRDWVRFPAEGFSEPASGVIYRTGDTVTNGMPLGGLDTGCIDLETSGLFGYCTIFNTHVPRRGPLNRPLLALSTGGKTWVLCDPQPKDGQGGYQPSASGRTYTLWRKNKHYVKDTRPLTPVPMAMHLPGVRTVNEIHYWGHYPVADLEFETDAPIGVGLRAWSPFLPGSVVDSMLPAVVFEVHLRNRTDTIERGTIAFSFPGPLDQEAGTDTFARKDLRGALNGVEVSGRLASYAAGVIGEQQPRFGAALEGPAWARIAAALPDAGPQDAGISVAVDFAIPARTNKVVRFVLSWHAPSWNAGGYNWAGAKHRFTHMYARHYHSAGQTAELLAGNHASLLRRILAWQQVLYAEKDLPVWLRDSLVNVLHLITEDGLWAQVQPPIPGWGRPADGLFGLIECPRGCPQIECIPCSFYGNQPIVYFFPQLALSTLRGYRGYQYGDGAAVWVFGGCTGNTPPIDFANPTRGYQFTTNGISLATMVDRYFLCYGDKDFVREFYPQIKQNMIYTVNLRPASPLGDRIIAMPTGNVGTEWFEAPKPGWAGMTAHVGGLHLAQLRIAERLAKAAGDTKFAAQCAAWIQAGAASMEKKLWTGSYYLNYLEPETNRRSDLVFGYQLDGEWITDQHGLPSALPADRVRTVLDTIRRYNVARSKYGAVNYTQPDGEPAAVGGYGTYSFFPPEALMLAMTYMYNGEREFGIELARKVWHNIVCLQGYTWDMPNIMRGDTDTGQRTFGNDYYQDMMLWSMPAAIDGQNFGAPAKPGGLVDRIIRAARDTRHATTDGQP